MIKSITCIAVMAMLLVSCAGKDGKTVNPIQLGKSYGPEKVDTSKAITVSEMLKDFGNGMSEKEYTFIGDIREVCSKAGCWINVEKGNGETFMVRFKDHFVIPPKTEVGSQAYVRGIAFMDTTSVELLQHFAEDAGISQEEIDKITEPKFELGFEADGITLIKKIGK